MKTILNILIVLVFLFTGTSYAAHHDIDTAEVVYYSGDQEVKGYLARPNDRKKHPALILIHEWWGLNDNIRDNAEKFAKLGYAALAVDMYNGQAATTRDGAKKLATGVRNNMPEAFKNLESAVAYLKGRAYVDSKKMASIGWCFGGGWSYQMAKNNLGIKASIIYYGRFNPKDDLQKMRAVILGHFGEEDRGIKVDTVHEFQASLKTLSGKHEVYIYKNAGHAFANGAVLACACDFRFMRKDHGYFCFPEIDVNVPFRPGIIDIAAKAVPKLLLQKMVYTGKRYTAQEMEKEGVIEKACENSEETMKEAIAFARSFQKGRKIFYDNKKALNDTVIKTVHAEFESQRKTFQT